MEFNRFFFIPSLLFVFYSYAPFFFLTSLFTLWPTPCAEEISWFPTAIFPVPVYDSSIMYPTPGGLCQSRSLVHPSDHQFNKKKHAIPAFFFWNQNVVTFRKREKKSGK